MIYIKIIEERLLSKPENLDPVIIINTIYEVASSHFAEKAQEGSSCPKNNTRKKYECIETLKDLKANNQLTDCLNYINKSIAKINSDEIKTIVQSPENKILLNQVIKPLSTNILDTWKTEELQNIKRNKILSVASTLPFIVILGALLAANLYLGFAIPLVFLAAPLGVISLIGIVSLVYLKDKKSKIEEEFQNKQQKINNLS